MTFRAAATWVLVNFRSTCSTHCPNRRLLTPWCQQGPAYFIAVLSLLVARCVEICLLSIVVLGVVSTRMVAVNHGSPSGNHWARELGTRQALLSHKQCRANQQACQKCPYTVLRWVSIHPMNRVHKTAATVSVAQPLQ